MKQAKSFENYIWYKVTRTFYNNSKIYDYIQLKQSMINSQVNQGIQYYIGLFNALSQKQQTQQANQRLMELQSSDQSWNIAKNLLLSNNPQYQLHGAQLLSKKLDRPYTTQMQSRYRLVDFILNLPQLNNILCYIIAKIALHLGWQQIQLGEHSSPVNFINVLKCIPSASRVIRLSPSINLADNQRLRASKIFNKYKQNLAQLFTLDPLNAMEVIENFVLQHFKLSSEKLVRLILTRPLSEIYEILSNLLICQKYESLHYQIYEYLKKQLFKIVNGDVKLLAEFNYVYISFVRCAKLLNMPSQVLQQIFNVIFSVLKRQNQLSQQQRQKCTYISDSYQFWAELQVKMLEAQSNQITNANCKQQLIICKQAFFQLWKIIVQRCLEYEMPKFREVTEDSLALVINLDDDEDDERINIEPSSDKSNKFRNNGQDFLNLVTIAFVKDQKYMNMCLNCLKQLTNTGNPLHLELAIFSLSCVIQNIGSSSIPIVNQLIQQIINNQNINDPYIWQQLIKFLGKLGHEAVCHGAIFQTALQIIKKSMTINQLAILSCQTFNQLLVTCNNSSEKENQTPMLQKLFQYIYSNIYYQTTQSAVFERLTKSSLLYIYYFKPDLQYFKSYLELLYKKIQSLKNVSDRSQVIQNLAVSHNYIMPQNSKMFTPMISQFFLGYLPVFISQISNAPSKKLGNIFHQVGLIISIGGGFNTELWVKGLLQISKIPAIQIQKSLLINLFNKIMLIQNYDADYKPQVIHLVTQAQKFVTSSLLEADNNAFKIINRGLTFHLNVLNNYIENFTNNNYDINSLLGFITTKIFRGFLRFQVQSTRTSLAIVRYVIQRNYNTLYLFEQCLKLMPVHIDIFWKSFESVLVQAYKVGGTQLYQTAFSHVFPNLAPPNPLFDVVVQSIVNDNLKEVKNLFAAMQP